MTVFKKRSTKADFQQDIYKQAFVNYFAHIEAYFQDVWRIIYRQNPHNLSSDLEYKLDEILKWSSYEELVTYIIDKKLSKSGYDKISDQLKRLNRPPFKFCLKLSDSLFKSWDRRTIIRNLILHNGSKVNSEYIEISDSEDKPGDLLELSFDEMEEIFLATMSLGHVIFLKVSSKLFKNAGDNLIFKTLDLKDNPNADFVSKTDSKK